MDKSEKVCGVVAAPEGVKGADLQNSETESRQENPRPRITEDWLRSVGFKWHQFDRQSGKHWLLWFGQAICEPDGKRSMWAGSDDLGIELGPSRDHWFCWFRSDSAGRYHRFIHLRHVAYQDEVIALAEAISGRKWDTANHIYGQMWTPEAAASLRLEAERLDIQTRTHPWTEAYKDPDRGKPLLEHVEEAVKGGGAK